MRILAAAVLLALVQCRSYGEAPLDLKETSFRSPDGKEIAQIQPGKDNNWAELNVTTSDGIRVGTTDHIYFTPVYSVT